MLTKEEDPARGAAAGLPGVSSFSGEDLTNSPNQFPDQARNPAAVAAAIADLTGECSVEAAHIASVTARHFCEQMELGDLWAAEHSLGVAVRHLREAAKNFRTWQALKRAEGRQ